ncbi:tetratricopeptide repeat protein [Actinosynnema sp. NPDC050436]|uniref:tetratricopeptide repeat protein n=1 Tax=Actinosynnema sp. NPDC050436 TaxID=3155659 RepID=UPI00340ADBA6
MTRCTRGACAGSIDETGYCDTCDRPPETSAAPQPATGASMTTAAGSAASGAGPGASRRSRESDPYALPVFDFPDPSSRILTDFRVPDRKRRCAGEKCPDRNRLPAGGAGYCLACGKPFSFLPSLEPGDLVEQRYEVLGCIDRGGLGWVYLAKDARLNGRLCVLKGLIDTADTALSQSELWALTQIDHPNIVGVYNFVAHPDAHTGETRDYIVMEYVSGLPLSAVAAHAQHGRGVLSEPLLTEHVITCVLQVLAALDHLHERGLLYCDLKPDNVIMRPDGQGSRANRVKLIDLGGVRRADDRTSQVVGTPQFQVSRAEIAEHGLTVRSEVHTVGETLHQLYRATADHTGQQVPAEQHLRDQQRIAPGIESFRRLCARAKDPDPARRFGGAAEMADQLRGVQREIAALRDGRPRPEPSEVFESNAVPLDAGLGAVPPLTRWTRRPAGVRLADLPLDVGTPSPRAVAVGLPAPRVHSADPVAALLDAATDDAARLLAVLVEADLPGAEAAFARCRAALAADDLDAARAALAQARERVGGTPDWRLWWHDGLVLLAQDEPDLDAARARFDDVYAALPGEIVPRLALAYCTERIGDPAAAESHYLAVWRRDRSVAGAVFGLARAHLARGDRAGAVALLDETPAISRHHDAARIAAVRVLGERLADGSRPSAADLAEAATRLAALHLDGGAPAGESRTRLEAVVHEARFGLGPATGGPETALRALLERCYRALARQAGERADRSDLVDLANQHRPFTFR